eukprot:767939-Hanusia_phi.AAC.4
MENLNKEGRRPSILIDQHQNTYSALCVWCPAQRQKEEGDEINFMQDMRYEHPLFTASNHCRAHCAKLYLLPPWQAGGDRYDDRYGTRMLQQ